MITVILPIFCNTQESLQYLRECLNSLDGQGCKFVAFDDGSALTLDVAKIVMEHKPILEKLIIGDKNQGVSYARNACAEWAETKLIFPLDCDDTLAVGALEKLEEAFEGVPLYPDVAKFGDEVDPWFNLLDFDCSHVLNYVGFTSVNVLHTKDQWKSIGGWDKDINFYEDGEYNARLFGRYCGKRFPEPLVNYRMHSDQRTKTFKGQAEYGKKLLQKIRSYDMACSSCAKKRRTASNVPGSNPNTAVVGTSQPTAVTVGQNLLNLPLNFEGKVLAQYVGGKGAGKHYYRGPATKFPYRVQFGDYVYVDPRDAAEKADQGHKFVLVQPASQPMKPIEQPEKPLETKVSVEVPKFEPEPIPVPPLPPPDVKLPVPVVAKASLPDINTLSVQKILALDESEDFDCHMAEQLLASEQRGLGRTKVIKFLESRVCEDD